MKKSALEIGTRVHAKVLDGAVTLTPRRLKTGGYPHQNQRYASADAIGYTRGVGMRGDMSIRVMRFAGVNAAEVSIRADCGQIESSMTPSQLRDLAQACIDMAHDIETNLAGEL